MTEQEKLTACLDISRRLSPANVEDTLGFFCDLPLIFCSDLIFIAEDVRDSLLSNIDVPLKTVLDTSVGRPFIISDYNRDGDSYRYSCCYYELLIMIL
jgi:capping protein beta